MNIRCSYCGQEHGLFRYIDKKGRTTVMYQCNRFPKLVGHVGEDGLKYQESRTVSTMLPVTEDQLLEDLEKLDLKSLPEVWSAKWAKKVQGQKQQQLVMFYDRR